MTHIKGFFENDTESRRKFSDLTGTIIVYVLTPTVHIYNYQRSQLLPPAVKCSLSRRRLSPEPLQVPYMVGGWQVLHAVRGFEEVPGWENCSGG